MKLYLNKFSYISPSLAYNLTGLKRKPEGVDHLTHIYRSMAIDYPKFFKMDNLSKLGFLAAEIIMRDEEDRFREREDVAVICFNSSSSLDTDLLYQKTIDRENFFPSPSLFVYTLPNIVTAEIAIRNKFMGETAFYISQQWDAGLVLRSTRQLIAGKSAKSVIAAWVEYVEGDFEAFMMRLDADGDKGIGLNLREEQADGLLTQLRELSNDNNKEIIIKK